jgi:UDP-N-acetylglucosamine 1-carboxyvinyltransferase
MDCLRISGGIPLRGTLAASGSKNAALPIMAASILADGPVLLQNIPDLVDVNTLALLLGDLGVEVKRQTDGDLRIETVDPTPTKAEYDLVRRMRASFCVLGPLVARRGRGVVSLPGGCNIGTRPVDLHLAGLAALGASIRIEHGYVIAESTRLTGAEIHLRGPAGPTVTGTANVMSAATLARGKTIITGAATEPEIADLGTFLNALGAQISGLGTDVIEIVGVEQLTGARYRIIPDRIEAATLLIAAAITLGAATIEGVTPGHLTTVLDALAETGASLSCGENHITLRALQRPRATNIDARPYPGVPTDLQAQFMALLSLSTGRSVIRDDVFPDRFMQVAELNRLGARIEHQGSTAVVQGVERLSGATVMASDLRASAALVLAGLAAERETIVRRIYHLDRGYEHLESKLAQLGAKIIRQGEDEAFSSAGAENIVRDGPRSPLSAHAADLRTLCEKRAIRSTAS